jgi:Ni,Fe-hydrogenase III large subunit
MNGLPSAAAQEQADSQPMTAIGTVLAVDPNADVSVVSNEVTVIRLSSDRLVLAVTALKDLPGARFADLFATANPLVLRTIYALDTEGRYVVLETEQTDDRLPALHDATPAAFVEECELFEQFGLQPTSDEALNRLAIPPHVGGDFPRLATTGLLRENIHAPHAIEGHAFEFPVGPVRAVGVESLYYGLVTSGEEVVDLYLFTWHKHRGIERRLRGLSPAKALFFVERAEGLSAVANSWAFASAVEVATRMTVDSEALRARALYLELERLYNHAQCIAALAQSTGLSVGQAQAEIALEQLLRVNAAVGGHRYLFGTLAIGGIGRPVDYTALETLLPAAHDELRRVLDALSTTNSFLDRLEATGQLTEVQARELGLVGPIARACGVSTDARMRQAGPPYASLLPRLALREGGDALARMQIMQGEFEESFRLLRLLSDDEACGSRFPDGASSGCGLGWAESARGECLAWVELDRAGLIRRARLRSASVRNWRAFDDAVRARNVFTDVPIIEASFWLTVAGRAM